MAKPKKPQPYILPAFKIEKVTPALEKKGHVYARLISAKNKLKEKFVLRERTGIEVEKYMDKPLECLAEIVKAQFIDPKTPKKDLPSDVVKGTFIGWDTGYKFFQELVSMVDGETGDAADEDYDEDEYDTLATELFSKWGIYGFGLDVYRDKPMIETDNGVFLLNEFIFEEQIDEWEQSLMPGMAVCFVIEELLLHGIKIYEGDWKISGAATEIKANHNEKIVVGRPKILK